MNNTIKHLTNGDFEVAPTVDITGVLKKWSILKRKNGKEYAIGYVSEDKKNRFPDGAMIYTSPIVRREGDIIHTLNSTYRLDGPEFKEAKD